MKNGSARILAALLLSGCTADFYERDADRQVTAIVTEREKQVLGYQPQVDVKSDPQAAKVTKDSYEKIPQTPIVPSGPPQVEPFRVELEYSRLGPRYLDWASIAPRESFSYEFVDEKLRQLLRYGPPSPKDRPMKVDFFGALRYGVEHSRTYQDQMENLYLAALDVTLARHLFEPRPFATASTEYAGGQKDINYRAALSSAVRAGVRQRLPYGGEIVAQGLVDFVSAIDGNASSGEDAAIVLSASIPLLRGAGMVNLEPLIDSERQIVYQVRDFESFRRDFVIQIAQQYFRLLNLQQAVLDRRVNYATFVQLTERSRALYAAGRINFLELQRSLQEVLTSENQLIDAQEVYFAALDDFKLTLGMPTDQPVEIVPVELQVEFPRIDETAAVELALKYRLDLQTIEDQLDDSRRRVENSKNGLLPDLNLTAQTEWGNRDNTPARQIDERTQTYSARLELELPLDRVAERNRYRAALIGVRQAQREVEQLRDTIKSDIRQSLRLIRQSRLTLEIQAKGIDLAQRRRENAYEALRSGKTSSTRDLVEAQNSLLRARDQYETAKATQQINILRFLRDAGTLRVDPASGAIGQAMDRQAAVKDSNNRAVRE